MSFAEYLLAHGIAFALGFVLDLLIGDPHFLLHPVQVIGALISALTKTFLKDTVKNKALTDETPANGAEQKDGTGRNTSNELACGAITVVLVLLATLLVSAVLFIGAYLIHPYLGILLEAIMTWQILAVKSLRKESMKVYKALQNGTIEDARHAVSMIVGRDTAQLNEEGVIKAAVETVAENTSDGIIAPMLYTAIGGPVLGFLYKSINTMDSMIGYKNDKYLYFGRCAAKLDDVVNFLPSRISAGFMIIASAIGGRHYSAKNAVKIYKRDRKNHASPNSAQTEAVCAGALGLRLAGDASYFGKIVKKPYIGDAIREPEREDIGRSNHLMILSAFLCELICLGVMILVWAVIPK